MVEKSQEYELPQVTGHKHLPMGLNEAQASHGPLGVLGQSWHKESQNKIWLARNDNWAAGCCWIHFPF